MRSCLLECVENALHDKAASKKVTGLAKLKLKAKALLKRCRVCGYNRFYCAHKECCVESHEDFNFSYCPDCGTGLPAS